MNVAEITERLTRPGLLGVAGKTVEKKCQKELAVYFRKLAGRIKELKLERYVETSDTPEIAKHAAAIRIGNAVRRDRELLKTVLTQNIAKAMLLADKLDSFSEKAEDEKKKTAPLQINQITVTGPGEGIDYLGLTGAQASELAAAQAGKLISGVEQTTIDLISDAVARGINEMLGVEGTSRLIQQVAEDMSVWRANLIAATEINDAMSQSALSKMKRIGLAFKQWIPDPANCCDICSDNADASPIPVDEDFPSGDDAPPAHPNCRCAVAGARDPDEDDSDDDE